MERISLRFWTNLLAIWLIASFLLLSANTTADEVDRQLENRLATALHDYHKNKRLTSLTFSLFQGQDGGFDHAIGRADVFGKQKASPQHIYTWASVTKPITALVVLDLVQRGMLALEDSVHQYITGFPKNVMVKDLLNHTSGFLREKENENFLTNSSHQNILRYLPIQFKSKIHRYANFNYAAVAAVIERVTGRPFREVVRDYFYHLTGEEIYFHNHTAGHTDSRFTSHYVRRYRRLYSHQPVEFGLWEAAAFAQTTSPALAKFLRLHLTPSFVEFLKSHAARVNGYINRQGQPVAEYYALGFRLRYVDKRLEYVYHNGFLYGVISTFYYFPHKNVGFVAASNMSSYPRQSLTLSDLYKIVERIVDEEFNRRVAEYTAENGYLKGAVFYETIKDEGELLRERIDAFAQDYLAKKQYREAISLFKLNNYVFSASAETYEHLAEAYMRSGYDELAAESVRKGLQVDPEQESMKQILDQVNTE